MVYGHPQTFFQEGAKQGHVMKEIKCTLQDCQDLLD